MKKNVLFFVATILLLGISSSCSKKELPFGTSEIVNNPITRGSQSDEALDSLIISIDEYNATLQPMLLASNPDTQRGFWSFLKKICKVVSADATGAAAGAAAGAAVGGSVGAAIGAGISGIASSLSAVVDQFELDAPNPKSNLTLPTVCPFISSQETGSMIGEVHNKITYQVIKSNPNFATMSEAELYNAIVYEYQNTYGSASYLPGITIISNLLNSVRIHLLENELNDVENWYTACQQITQNQPKINKLIVDFTLNIARTKGNDNVRSYTKGYYKIVEKSKITTAEKSLILDGISVAANSSILWNTSISN